MPYRIPSHVTRNNGCARSRREAKYRNLWPDFAWSPCLGNTGANVREHIVQQDGVLTSMVPADDWVLSEGRGALDLDGMNDHNLITNAPNTTGDISAAQWVYTRSGVAGSHFEKWGGAGSRSWIIYDETFGSGFYQVYLSSDGTASTSITGTTGGTPLRNAWQHVGFSLRGTSAKIFVDGKLAGSATHSGGIFSSSSNITIGADLGGSQFHNGLIDDSLLWFRGLTEANFAQLYSLGRGGWAEKRKRRIGVAGASGALLKRMMTEGLFTGKA